MPGANLLASHSLYASLTPAAPCRPQLPNQPLTTQLAKQRLAGSSQLLPPSACDHPGTASPGGGIQPPKRSYVARWQEPGAVRMTIRKVVEHA